MSDARPPDADSGPPDLARLVQGFQEMQEARATEYEGQAGGGVVRITATGEMEFQSVTIEPDVVDPDDVEMLADLVLAALRDLSSRVADAQREAIASIGIGDLGDLGDLGKLGNLFGDVEQE